MAVNNNKDVSYDIIIDPGHGGKDPGACYNKICETNYTLNLANLLKEKLESYGLRVILTRDSDIYLNKYGKDSRVSRVYNSYAKLMLSIHLNTAGAKLSGFEFYTPSNIDLSLARDIVSGLKDTGLNTSSNRNFKVEDGVYTRTFTSSDVKSTNEGVTPYPNVSTKTNYYFMIRETGGYMSGSYVDGRDGKTRNDFYNSNVGVESYILEVSYINNPSDLERLDKNKEKYMNKLGNILYEYIK